MHFNKSMRAMSCFLICLVRLWICGIAVAIAMFGLAWDFLYPFPLSRPVLILCSGSYFLLMGVLTLALHKFTTEKVPAKP